MLFALLKFTEWSSAFTTPLRVIHPLTQQLNIPEQENRRNPANIYLFKFDNRNIRKMCEICSKLTIKTPGRSDVFIINFEHISHLFLAFPYLILHKKFLLGS